MHSLPTSPRKSNSNPIQAAAGVVPRYAQHLPLLEGKGGAGETEPEMYCSKYKEKECFLPDIVRKVAYLT